MHVQASCELLTLPELITRDDVVSQRLKFGSAFLSFSSKISLFFLVSRIPCPSRKIVWIFIGRNVEARANQAGLHKPKKDTASAKEGKVS